MRIKTITTILSLAIIAASTFAAEAQRAGGPGNGNNGRNNGRTTDISVVDRGEGDSENRRRPCYVVGAASVDCPPPPKRKMTLRKTAEGDCECKSVVMLVGGAQRAVLDCYQTKLVENIKRTYVCQRPE